VNGVFSVDGTRLFMNDDSDDVFQIFSVDASTGALDMLFEGESTSYHGMAVHPDLPLVYNGADVFEIDTATDVATRIFSDFSAGNGTTIVDFDGSTLLVTTEDTSTVGVYDLADPASPAEVARLTLSGNQARDIAVIAGDTLRIVVVGRNRVATLELNGSTLDEVDVVELETQPPLEHRKVHLIEGGGRALVAWFRFTYFAASGGFTIYDVGADGSLTEGETVELPFFSRSITDATLN
jgi:Tol biopolymer transport system component